MTTQSLFDYEKRKQKKPGKPKHGPELARKLIAILAVKRRFVKRCELISEHRFTARECRMAREASHSRVIATQQGYCLLRHATPDDIREARNAFVAQKTAATRSIMQLDKRAHESLARKMG